MNDFFKLKVNVRMDCDKYQLKLDVSKLTQKILGPKIWNN